MKEKTKDGIFGAIFIGLLWLVNFAGADKYAPMFVWFCYFMTALFLAEIVYNFIKYHGKRN